MRRSIRIVIIFVILYVCGLAGCLYADFSLGFYSCCFLALVSFIGLCTSTFLDNDKKFKYLVSRMDENETISYFEHNGESCEFVKNKKDADPTYAIIALYGSDCFGNKYIAFSNNYHSSQWYISDFVSIYF